MITIKIDTTAVSKMLQGAARQLPFAISLGLNKTAQKVKAAAKAGLATFLDRPTPFTLNSLQLTPSKKTNLEAKVYFKQPQNLGQKAHYLTPQVYAGNRPLKPYEMGLGGRLTVPGKGANLDRYGNLGKGKVGKILSQSKSFRASGFTNSRSSKGSKVGDMFMLTSKRGKLLPGIYERTAGSETGPRLARYMLSRSLGAKKRDLSTRYKDMYPRGIKSVLLFSKPPAYTKRYDFYGIAKATAQKELVPSMVEAVQYALKTAR